MMIRILQVLIVLFSVNTVNAQNICNPGCAIKFVFSAGGTIVAADPMIFIFSTGSSLNLGSGGTINTAVQPASFDFSTGGVLNLATGDSITFGNGGSLVMAQGSNLDAVDFDVITGDVTFIQASDPAVITIMGQLNIDGVITVNNSKLLTINNDIVTDMAIFYNPGGSADILLAGTGRIIAGLTETKILINTAFFIYTGIISIDEITGFVKGTRRDLNLLNGELLSSRTVFDISKLQGQEIVLAEGVVCVVSGNECVTESGDVYLYGDTGFVKQAKGGGGSLNTASLLIIFFTYYLLNIKRKKRI